jgi:hypothetical protein
MSSAVRAAYMADTSELAFQRRSADGQWGLALGNHAQEAIIDMIGLSFIPLYRIIGPASIIVIFILFFVGMTRITITILFRVIVLGCTRGCGYWILAAFFGCIYQVVISRWLGLTVLQGTLLKRWSGAHWYGPIVKIGIDKYLNLCTR